MDLHAHTHAFCISFLLALKQNTKNLVAENDTYVIILQFRRPEV